MTAIGMLSAILVGGAAGVAAGQLMDRVTTEFLERQSESSKRREQEVSPETYPTTKLVKRIGEATGTEIEEEQASRMGGWLHTGLAVSGGLAAAMLARRRMSPMGAGLASGMGLWLVGDEGINPVLGLTPPATAYPWVTHARGLVGHVAYGLALGTLLAASQRIWRH